MTREWNPLHDLADSIRAQWQTLAAEPRYLAYAVLAHVGFLLLLIVGLHWSTVVRPSAPLDVIQATLVDGAALQKAREEQDRNRAQEAERLRQQREAQEAQERARHEEEIRQRQEQAAEEARKREAQRLVEMKQREEARKRQEQESRRREAQRQAEIKKQDEQRRAEEARKQEEQRRAAEAKRQEEEKQRLAEEQRRQAQAAQEAAERARREQSEVDRYVNIIKQQVARNWNKPDNWKKGQECTVRVSLIPGGDVVGVTIVRCTGDPILDRSVDSAVRKASPLRVPPADNPLFDRFRELQFVFNPES
jgi:colicin import membrane protein